MKKAHTETVIPVCDDDYKKIPKFANVETYKRYRNSQNTKPISKDMSEKILNDKSASNDIINTNMAYKLAKQDEEMQKVNDLWWKNLRLLQ